MARLAFSHPGPNHVSVAFLPEWQFNFPALPVAQSDAIVIAEVLNAEAHRSEVKLNVFSNFEVRVDEFSREAIRLREMSSTFSVLAGS